MNPKIISNSKNGTLETRTIYGERKMLDFRSRGFEFAYFRGS